MRIYSGQLWPKSLEERRRGAPLFCFCYTLKMAYLWGLSEKSDGQMKIYPDDNGLALDEREKFLSRVGLELKNVVSADLVHGNQVAVVGESDKGKIILATDGLITATPNLILTVTVADCLPVYFFDEEKQVIALAHAGWRGLVKNIMATVVSKMKGEFGSDPKNIIVNVGPHIRDCHFVIGSEVARQFTQYQQLITKKDDQLFLNLSAVAKEQLIQAGILSDHITISPECTYDLPAKYFSYRRDKPSRVEAMLAYAGHIIATTASSLEV